MSAFVDTNILVRHLTGEPADMAARATAFLASADESLPTDLIVAETIYVLESNSTSYRKARRVKQPVGDRLQTGEADARLVRWSGQPLGTSRAMRDKTRSTASR